jgi:hypothetical protein
VQHELRANMSIDVGYFRTWFGNLTITDNVLVTPADYDPFCITAPRDSRLPGGGGQQICDLGDIKPEKFGLVDNVITQASQFGDREQVYDGVDAKMQARFGDGGLLTGGLNVGRTRNHCVVVDAPVQFCDNRPPFLTEVKVGVSYPLPWDLRASAVIQNVPGSAICNTLTLPGGPQCAVTYVATNAEIAPSLGRNLAACGNVTVGCTAFATVNLLEPNTHLEDRAMQVDLRFSRALQFGRARVQGKFDVYNVFNEDAVARMNTFFGSSYLLPTEVMSGRLFKVGAQIDF